MPNSDLNRRKRVVAHWLVQIGRNMWRLWWLVTNWLHVNSNGSVSSHGLKVSSKKPNEGYSQYSIGKKNRSNSSSGIQPKFCSLPDLRFHPLYKNSGKFIQTEIIPTPCKFIYLQSIILLDRSMARSNNARHSCSRGENQRRIRSTASTWWGAWHARWRRLKPIQKQSKMPLEANKFNRFMPIFI